MLVDEESALEVLTLFSWHNFASIDECRTENIANIYYYEKEEDTTYISVKVIRDWIAAIYEKPYTWKNLYIIRYFDESTHQAMNASLKVLEEPPEHAIILLVVKNPESVLETIRSRTLNLYKRKGFEPLSEEIVQTLQSFESGNILPLIELNQSGKLDETTILLILIELLRLCGSHEGERIENAIDSLLEVHENPRNILDRVLLYL